MGGLPTFIQPRRNLTLVNDNLVDRSSLLALLGSDVRRDGEWLMTWCPAHNDGVKHGKKGRDGRSLGLSNDGVLKCFAGCNFKDILEALDYQPDVKPTPISAAKPAGPRPPDLGSDEKLTAVYEVRDQDGKLLAEKGRIDNKAGGKRFSWRMPGTQGWPSKQYGGGLIDTSPNDLPPWPAEKVAAADPKQWVIICEGEKAAQACMDHGFIACSYTGGADQRIFGNQTFELFRDRKVALWPDNDEPGFRYMARLAKLLGPIARQLRYITVPSKPKEDAWDYFYKDQLPAADVFKTTWEEPLVDFLGADRIRVTTFTKSGPMLFDFAELNYVKGELHTELEVTPMSQGMDDESMTTRQNLISTSGREGLERMLKKQFGDVPNWTQAISQAYKRARDGFAAQERGLHIGDAQRMGRIQWVLEGLLARGHHSVLFGDGSSGKTMFGYLITIALASGLPLWGRDTMPQASLIVDYETSERVARWRIERLMVGLGMDATTIDSLPIHYWAGGGIPIADQADAIRKYTRKQGIDFMMVDSGGVACGLPPEKSEAAIQYFNGCLRTGVETVLTICHVAGMSDGQFPFGSKFWHNLARATYFMKASGVGTDEIGITLFPRKANETKRGKDEDFLMTFTPGDQGPVVIESVQGRQAALQRQALNEADQIWAVLRQQPDLKSYEVAQLSGIPGDRVSMILQKAMNDWVEADVKVGVAGGIRTWRATSSEPPSQLAV